MSNFGWIGVDLDGTLAEYSSWKGIEHIGAPVPAMAERVRGWLTEGREVRIMTARVCHLFLAGATEAQVEDAWNAHRHIQDWTEEVFGVRLRVTALKDFAMLTLYDDRAVQVEINTGRLIEDKS